MYMLTAFFISFLLILVDNSLVDDNVGNQSHYNQNGRTAQDGIVVNIAGEMGMIFQSAALFDSMTVLDNVMFPLNMFSNDTLRDRTRRAMFCLERVNLIEAKDKFPGEISGGMQKRVAIARAIALNPQYLFCDEPNSGLDPKTSLVIDELIQDITREYNMTTLINTHDMNSVMGIGEKIIYIYEGHKEWEGNKDDIFTSTNERLNSFIFASDLFRGSRTNLVQCLVADGSIAQRTAIVRKHFVNRLRKISTFFIEYHFIKRGTAIFSLGRLPFKEQAGAGRRLQDYFLAVSGFIQLIY